MGLRRGNKEEGTSDSGFQTKSQSELLRSQQKVNISTASIPNPECWPLVNICRLTSISTEVGDVRLMSGFQHAAWLSEDLAGLVTIIMAATLNAHNLYVSR